MTNTFKIPRKYTSAQANIYFNPVTSEAFITDHHKIVKCSEATLQRLNSLCYNTNIRVTYFRYSHSENWIIFQRREIPKTPEVLALSKH